MLLKHLPPAENTSHRSDGQGMTDGGTALAPATARLPGRGSLNHLHGGMNQPELTIIGVFICRLCNFGETVSRTACCASRTRPKSAPPPD
jgi:hypothetical protein